MTTDYLDIRSDIAEALAAGAAVVALESTIIAHGLPWPDNLHCAHALETIVRDAGAIPATIGICQGRIKIGLGEAELEYFAKSENIIKLSRRDLAALITKRGDGATTVAATMICAHLAGIRVFATGGIGGVHRGVEKTMDISADLTELARTPVTVVCAGAKSILDLAKTLEVLETYGVPVLGYQSDQFPAFYLRNSGLPVDHQVDSVVEVAKIIETHQQLGLSSGTLVSVPIPEQFALLEDDVEHWIEQALAEADKNHIIGKAITPFLLERIVELSEGKALQANLELVKNNTRVATEIAKALAQQS